MARYRNSSLVNKDISSENLPNYGTIGQMGSGNQPISSMPNTPGGPRMPEGFVNFDRMVNQNRDTVARKGAELDQVAGNVAGEISKASGQIRGAGNAPKQLSFDRIMELSLKASQGDQGAKTELDAAMNPQDVAENAAVTDPEGYTKGMNTLSSATTAPSQGRDNYGAGALNFALGDAVFGNKLREKVRELSSGMQDVKDQSVKRNKEIQEFNKNLVGVRERMKNEGRKAFGAMQNIADNPGTYFIEQFKSAPHQQGEHVGKYFEDAQKNTVGGMKEIAKYLGINPDTIRGNPEWKLPSGGGLPSWPNTVWDQKTNSWVAPGGTNPEPTPEEVEAQQQKSEDEREKKISPQTRQRLSRIPNSGY